MVRWVFRQHRFIVLKACFLNLHKEQIMAIITVQLIQPVVVMLLSPAEWSKEKRPPQKLLKVSQVAGQPTLLLINKGRLLQFQMVLEDPQIQKGARE